MPKVSVIVPSYNKPEYLPECLRSVQAQTFTDWECIVVNDGSPRGDEIRAAVAAMNDPRFRLVEHEINRGLAAARNTGVREASSELVICVDEDDWIRDDCLEKLLFHFEHGCPDIVCPQGWMVGARPRARGCRLASIEEILVHQTFLPAGFLLRKSAWQEVGGWDEHPILARGREDTEWWIRVVRHGFRIRVIEEPLYLYRAAQTADDAARSLDMNARRDEVELRKYIIRKHGDLYAKYPSQRRRLLAMACQAEASFHLSAGNHWRSILRGWQATVYSPDKRTILKALRTTLAALLGERMLESIRRWKTRITGVRDAETAG